ncbi:MAG: hypothetical protein IPH96_17965 [Saprospiraceae bacterium]|nr:hypothetical protein [Saprospiraceae bacterium]
MSWVEYGNPTAHDSSYFCINASRSLYGIKHSLLPYVIGIYNRYVEENAGE